MMAIMETRLSFPGGLFFWGATNTSRESTMYPKAVQDLCGWRIRSLACGYVAVSPGERGRLSPCPACWTHPGGALSLEGSTLPMGRRAHQILESGGGGAVLGAKGVGRS